jgi:hypothetical protein
MEALKDILSVDAEILGGQPVFSEQGFQLKPYLTILKRNYN